MIDNEIAGCGALVISDSQAELEHLWVKPNHMGNGVGRALFLKICERAIELNAPILGISADPNAEGFYERMGATRIGDVLSEVDGQLRVLPRMAFDLKRVPRG